jgi:hypothetical protein
MDRGLDKSKEVFVLREYEYVNSEAGKKTKD